LPIPSQIKELRAIQCSVSVVLGRSRDFHEGECDREPGQIRDRQNDNDRFRTLLTSSDDMPRHPMETNLKSTDCIKIRRLFDAAAGFTKLEESEHQHVHECQLCQGVFYIFIGLHSNTPPAASPKKTSAA